MTPTSSGRQPGERGLSPPQPNAIGTDHRQGLSNYTPIGAHCDDDFAAFGAAVRGACAVSCAIEMDKPIETLAPRRTVASASANRRGATSVERGSGRRRSGRCVVVIPVAPCQLPDMLTSGAGGAVGFTLKLPLPRWPLIACVLCASEIVAWAAASLI